MAIQHGSCHCGAVRFRIDAELTEATSCDCSLCTKKNAVMTQVPVDGLTILEGEDALSLYQWNTKVARHYFCSACGIYTFHRKRSLPDHYGVNVFCLDDFDPASLLRRAAEGVDMTVVETAARPEWKGPRVDE
ncbi:hypothetical protein BH11PSE2_BH11PSE2_19150 [soil metagenome]